MSYETNLMETEVFALNIIHSIKGIPVPKVLFYDNSKDTVNSEYFFMEFVDGESLHTIRKTLTKEQYNSLSSQLGEYTKRINGMEGNYFGSISQVNKRYNTWSEAFLNMIRDLLNDAEELNVSLPYETNDLYSFICEHKNVLNQVKHPSLVHKDLWEGNIFINTKTSRISGIIDCERALYGDPLLEPVCGLLLDNKHFMNAYMGRVELDRDEQIRVLLYKIYLYLLMVIECEYRQYSDKNIDEWARKQLIAAMESLRKY